MAASRRPSLLIVSYYFPPWGMGGVQRALKFAKYLPEFGWDVTVIAPHFSRYYQTDRSLLADIPETVRIERVATLDLAVWLRGQRRHGSGGVRGERAPAPWVRSLREWLRWPDDKVVFAMNARRRAQRLLREQPFDAVWTTSPPPSVHRVGLGLHKRIPWIADFRDPWLARDDDWGPTRWHVRHARRLRQRIVRTADRLIAVSEPMAAALDAEGPRHATEVIHNGYDEADFPAGPRLRSPDDPFTILCPGTFSPHSDPRPILAAVRALLNAKPGLNLRVVHVGTALRINPAALAGEYGLASIFVDLGYLEHRTSIRALLGADAIAISVSELPGFATNIPGRLYEALRSLRPLVLFGPQDAAVGALVGRLPGCRVVPPSDSREAAAIIEEIMQLPRDIPARSIDSIRMFDRREQARRLAALCDTVRAERSSEMPP